MRRGKLQPWRVASGVVVVAALAVPALAGGASAASNRSEKQASGKADTSAVLRVGAGMDVSGGATFDPANPSTNAGNSVWMQLVYGSMIYDTGDGGSRPGLATEWSVPDPRTIKLTLRKTTFSDGTPFNAPAVKAAWDRRLASEVPGAPLTAEYEAISEVEAVDDRHIVVHFSAPIAESFLKLELRAPAIMAVPSPAAAASGTLNQAPIGAGPYVLESRDGNQALVFKKNPKYFDAKNVQLSGITFTNVATGVTQVNGLMSGAIDVTWGLPQDSLDAVSNNPDLNVLYFPGGITTLMSLCSSPGRIFESKEARQAIQHAIDREAINDSQYNGSAEVNQLPMPPSHSSWDKKLNSTYDFSPKKARALLKQAGIAPGRTVQALVPAGPAYATATQVIQANLEEVGLDMEITPTQNSAADSIRTKSDITFSGAAPQFFSRIIIPETTFNPCSWFNQTIQDSLATVADTSQPPARIKAAWNDFTTTMLDESPLVFYATPPFNVVTAGNVKGINAYLDVRGPQLVDAYVTRSS